MTQPQDLHARPPSALLSGRPAAAVDETADQEGEAAGSTSFNPQFLNDRLNARFLSFQLVAPQPKLQTLAMVLFWGMGIWMVLLMFIPWQQTSHGSGRVVAYSPTERQQSIDAPVDGRLGQWFVYEGSIVKEGDPIVKISDNDPEILSRLQSEREALVARLNAAELSAKTAKINLTRQKFLSEQGLSSRRSFELAKLEHAKYLSDVASASAELARIGTRIARQSTQFVMAPRSGTILRRIAGEGSVLVKAGASLATIVPDTESRAVEFWIEGRDVALMSEGQEVRLQFEGWPAIQFSGWPSVAVGSFRGKIGVIDATDNGQGKFRVMAVPDQLERWPNSRYLRQGIRAQGWVLLSRVSLGYELWRRFNGFPPTVPEPEFSMQTGATPKK